MSTITNNINNITNIPTLSNISQSAQNDLVSQSIKNSIIDTVNFSDEAVNLFQISEIDSLFDGIFGIPNELDDTQQKELDSLRLSLDTLFPSTSSNIQTLDFDKTYTNLVNTILQGNLATQEQSSGLEAMATELKSYLSELSLNQLSGDATNNFSLFSQGFDTIFDQKLTQEESNQLSSLSLQLNRLFFTSEDSQTSSFLDTFNSLYGLNNPDQNQLNQAIDLLAQRNTLLSSSLLNRDFDSTYTGLL